MFFNRKEIFMKTAIRSTISLVLLLSVILSLAACGAKYEGTPWENATYTEDKSFGDGAKTIKVTVEAGEKSVVFTIKTDKATVGEAMQEHGLIEGEQGAYGLYVKKVNGIVADYDIDQTYWGFYINGEYAMTGVDMTEITEGAVYRLVRTK